MRTISPNRRSRSLSGAPRPLFILVLSMLLLSTSLSVLAGCASGDPLVPGTTAPDRPLRDHENRIRTLASFRGAPLVVFFYPKDATPGCTREACAFRDVWERYETTGVQVVGVSSGSVASHAAFAAEHELPFPLLADVDGELADAFGVPRRLGMPARVTFLLDADGVVRATFREVDPGVHAGEILDAVARLGLAPATRAPER